MKRKKLAALFAVIIGFFGFTAQKLELVSDNSIHAEVADSQLWIPVIFLDHQPETDSILGVQVYGSFTESSKYHPFFVDSGAEWIRNRVDWKYVEPNNVDPAQYQWHAADSSFAMSRSDNGAYKIIGTIEHNPEWAATSENGPIDKVPLSEFTDFVGVVVERYDGDGFEDAPGSPIVAYWEFYNEPDNRDFWGHATDEYAQMLAAVYPVVKAANPSAKVAVGGLAHDWFERQGGPFVEDFIDQVLLNGGGPYFDVMNFHAYPSFNHFWGSEGPTLIEKTNSIRSRLANYGYGDKPMVVTETGWHSNSPPAYPSNEDIQANYVVELLVQGMAADLDLVIWWMFNDPGAHYYDNGLVTNSTTPEPKLAFQTYKTFTSQFENTQFVRTLGINETGSNLVEAHHFQNVANGRNFYTVWLNPMESTNVMQISLPHEQVAVRHIISGSVIDVIIDQDDGNNDGRVSIGVSSRPVYIEVNQ